MQAITGFRENKSISRWLQHSPVVLVCCVSFAAFVVYSSMYGFRKPYTSGLYANLKFAGISYKVCLVIAQVLGYMISKFYGIRFIAGMQPAKRGRYILLAVLVSWLALFLFAIIPPPFNIVCLFINGLPLGIIFGLVMGYLEGRRTTEIMGAFLAISFIFASGLAKTTGKWILLYLNINEWWMPFTAGAIFIIPLCVSVWLLQHTPPPTAEDIAQRTVRNPMTQEERRAFLRQFGIAMIPVVLSYSIFTIVRDFSEDFANELWIETGVLNNAGIFAQTSTIISLVALAVIAVFFLIRNNFTAFRLTHYLVMIGVAMSALSSVLFNVQLLSPIAWMLFATTGLYLAYLPFNCLYFERLLSAYKIRGNVGFVMYIADAFGYLGTVMVLLVKEFIPIQYKWTSFFSFLFYTAGIAGIILMVIALCIHHRLTKTINSST